MEEVCRKGTCSATQITLLARHNVHLECTGTPLMRAGLAVLAPGITQN